MKKSRILTVLLGVGLSAAVSADQVSQLYGLFEREWEHRLRADPLLATSVGRHEYDGLLPDVSRDAQERRAEATREFLRELAAIDRSTLERSDRINYDIFRRQLEMGLEDLRFRDYEIPLNADSGFHTDFAWLPNDMPLATVDGYEDYLARLRAFPRYVDQQIANMRAGLERGMSLPRVVLQGYEVSIESHVVDSPEESVFWEPFASFPAGIPAGERERLRRAGRAAIRGGVVMGYRRFLDFMLKEYIPGTRESLGASELPEGRDYYLHKIRYFTTLDLTPEEIHEIGQGEVARIRGEMEGIIDGVGFEGSFDEFLEFLRTDRRFYARTPEELLREAAFISKKMDGKLPSLFKTLPRLPYTVEAVPEYLAPKYTTGRYVGPPWGSTEPGRYWVNTYDLQNRPLYNLEALSLHEARLLPGSLLRLWAAHLRDVAGLPPGGRHRPPRDGLDAGSGDAVSGLEHRATAARGPDRDRSIYLLARPGTRLQAGRAGDQEAAKRSRRGPWRAIRPARVPRRRARQRLGAAAAAATSDRELHPSESSVRLRLIPLVGRLLPSDGRTVPLGKENLLDWPLEESRDAEGQRQAGIELAGLDGVDRLARDLELRRQRGLGPVALGAQHLETILHA
jgi:uncharacterized protein (DUF885 family)